MAFVCVCCCVCVCVCVCARARACSNVKRARARTRRKRQQFLLAAISSNTTHRVSHQARRPRTGRDCVRGRPRRLWRPQTVACLLPAGGRCQSLCRQRFPPALRRASLLTLHARTINRAAHRPRPPPSHCRHEVDGLQLQAPRRQGPVRASEVRADAMAM